MPDEVQFIADTCSARLNHPKDICAGNVKKYRILLPIFTPWFVRCPGQTHRHPQIRAALGPAGQPEIRCADY
jgi:hypothetical protein